MQYIQETYMRRPMKREWEDEPRDPLARYCVARMVTPPAYVSVQFMGPSGVLWRCVGAHLTCPSVARGG